MRLMDDKLGGELTDADAASRSSHTAEAALHREAQTQTWRATQRIGATSPIVDSGFATQQLAFSRAQH